MNNKSPLRYPGGKTRACKIIEQELLKYTDLSKYSSIVSPFFGGGSFEFYLQNKYNYDIIANDKFEPLYQFWQTAKSDQNKLCTLLATLRPCSKEKFKEYREGILKLNDPLMRAAHYFVINRCSFSGATLSGGFSKQAANSRFTESSIARVKALNLSKTSFYNQDYTKFLCRRYYLEALIFLDPPYYLEKGSKLYGKNGDMHEAFTHSMLAALLKENTNWVLCYNDCDYIRNLYEGYTIISVNWSYGMNKTKKSSEILILSF